MKTKRKILKFLKIDGDNILYHYFQNHIIKEESEEEKLILTRMLSDLSIWLPIDLYIRMPILIPYAVRDPTCRKSVNKIREEWGSCNSSGYFRDDNTLIKAIPRQFKIISNKNTYPKSRIGIGFVASHVWRKLSTNTTLASRNPLTNTFVPNLVWLPRQLSKLTDREGSFSQKYLQALSIARFNHLVLDEKKRDYVRRIWQILPSPKIKIDDKHVKNLNFFDLEEEDIQKKVNGLLTNINLIKESHPKRKLHCSRYFLTYSKLPERTKTLFTNSLSEYANIIAR